MEKERAAIVPTTGTTLDTWRYAGRTLEELFRFSKMLLLSGLLHEGLRSPAAVALVLLKGRELGLPPIYSMNEINVIKGKAAASATLVLALMRRAGVRHQWLPVEDETKEAILELVRPDGTKHVERFTIDDAKRAGLLGPQTKPGSGWLSYPKALLRARAITAGGRAFCPDLIGGVDYVQEELGVEVDDEGTVLRVGDEEPEKRLPQPEVEDASFEEVEKPEEEVKEEPQAPAPELAPDAAPEPDPEKLAKRGATTEKNGDLFPKGTKKPPAKPRAKEPWDDEEAAVKGPKIASPDLLAVVWKNALATGYVVVEDGEHTGEILLPVHKLSEFPGREPGPIDLVSLTEVEARKLAAIFLKEPKV